MISWEQLAVEEELRDERWFDYYEDAWGEEGPVEYVGREW